MNKKNKDAQILPPVIFEKIFGSVMNNNDGPCPTETPYEKHAGKIIKPAVIATKVSSAIILALSPPKDLSSFM